MKNSRRYLYLLSGLVMMLAGFEMSCPAQSAKTGGQADVPSLISKLEDKDQRIVRGAAQALADAGTKVVPVLIDALREKKGCQFQWVASGVVHRLNPRHEIVNSTLINIIKGRCEATSPRDLIIRRQAAFALVAKPEGVPIVAGMLKEKDTFIRRSAAFAFDELTERLQGRSPAIPATPEIINATKAALPSLVEALNDKDEVVRCMSYEALEQVRGSKHEILRSEANRLMQDLKVQCPR